MIVSNTAGKYLLCWWPFVRTYNEIQ